MAMAVENQQSLAQTTMPQLVPRAAPPLPPPPPPPPLPQAYRHRCKVCKKGFTCGRALGGHMRAHGVADNVLSTDDDEEEEDDGAGPCGGGGTGDDYSSEAASPSTTKRSVYALRANPGRPRSCRVCENCGKEFTSWKLLLDHGRCSSYGEEGDDETDVVMRRYAEDDGDGEEDGADLALAGGGWSQGKRTRRGKVMMEVANGSVTEATTTTTSASNEEEDLANCLVMLSSSRSVQPQLPAVVGADQSASCAPANKDHMEIRNSDVLVPQPISVMAPTTTIPELKLLPPPQVVVSESQQPAVSTTVPRGLFECKACKKVFTSHQALGGHRASHKKVKGCYAAKLDSDQTEPPQPVTSAAPIENIKASDDGNPMNSVSSEVVMATAALETPIVQAHEPADVSPPRKKGKVHECSICHRVFVSGQALGSHKRCHWLTTASGAQDHHHAVVAQDHGMRAVCQQLTLGRPMFDAAAAHHPVLDLNAPTNASANATKQQAAELNGSVLCLNAPAASLYLQSWTTVHGNNASNVNRTTAASSRNHDAVAASEDEADSRSAKRGKIISDLKDLNVAGETSPWLQVGIGLPSESKEKSVQE